MIALQKAELLNALAKVGLEYVGHPKVKIGGPSWVRFWEAFAELKVICLALFDNVDDLRHALWECQEANEP